MSQHVQLELAEQPAREVPLYKRPIRYVVPWYAIVAAGFFTFSTTWRSEACVPDDFTVIMASGEVRIPSSSAEAESRTAQEKWMKKAQKSEEAAYAP
jgi:hypothetical protein